ncbi:hypothetical protein [Clostridium magnum]|uniref:Uncharacterized protein n=1 Tax=Clostridium magnum DSM 2767 TaxID=1121326 RepID=A0A161X565_9CLOT|nr:hypothetical protein [Clostridium magnum]KZL89106.1 hypothetical protein CLMAG_55920 [Clostridium magnum DSM 2767]SHI29088.1 hypothetical protein SAMN02745944_04040 [Clostridium magnum DSM 2767]
MRAKKLPKFMPIIIAFTIILAILYAPVGAIRMHLFFSNPIQSLTCSVKKSRFIDSSYGQQYLINGFKAGDGSGGIYFAYVKRNSIGWYYWPGGGSGP